MRALKNEQFLDDLENGILAPLTKEVQSDHTLSLELRESYVNVYYRGGNLMKVEEKSGNVYSVEFDKEYFKGADHRVDLPGDKICKGDDIVEWLRVLPCLKRVMDHYFVKTQKSEREFQQLVVRENNFGSVARSTDYYICDVEYGSGRGRRRWRFDMIAVHWPSDGHVRKKTDDRRLVLAEMKYGDDALSEKSGLHKHIKDVNEYLGNSDSVRGLKNDMVRVFNQKRKLCLIKCRKDLEGFSDKLPIFLLLLANHDPDSIKLNKALENLPAHPNIDLRIATASFFGYGLYDQGVHEVEEFRKCFRRYIHSGSV